MVIRGEGERVVANLAPEQGTRGRNWLCSKEAEREDKRGGRKEEKKVVT